MRSPESEPIIEQNKLADEVGKRSSTASEKIKQRVSERFIPNINQQGNHAAWWLDGLRNDFYHLAEDPNEECGGGQYEGWTAEEIRELYSVLYGEEMD